VYRDQDCLLPDRTAPSYQASSPAVPPGHPTGSRVRGPTGPCPKHGLSGSGTAAGGRAEQTSAMEQTGTGVEEWDPLDARCR
jgi:hypothetical protein